MKLFGYILPSVGRYIVPCDPDGVVSLYPHEIDNSMHETKTIIFAWFGFCFTVAYGEVEPRLFQRG